MILYELFSRIAQLNMECERWIIISFQRGADNM